jgi:SAM-dependent methyltransferase
MAAFFAPGGAGEILPRLVFLEPLLAGRRVLEVGGAGATDGASALLLAERGAASVLSLDDAPGTERAARTVTHPAVQFRHAAPEQLPPGSFDVVVAHDGLALAGDPGRLDALRALLSPAGVLLTAVPAPWGTAFSALAGAAPASEAELPPYEHVAAALARAFPVVEAATQAPALGYAVAAGEGGEELPFRVDGSLGGTVEAAFYLFLCAPAPTGLRGVSLVTLPGRELWEGAQAAQRERAEAAAVARTLAGEAGALRAAGAALREDLDHAGAALAVAYGELAQAGARTAEWQARAGTATHGLLDARARLAAEREAAEGLRGAAAAAEAGREGLREELDRADRALAAAYAELARAGERVGERAEHPLVPPAAAEVPPAEAAPVDDGAAAEARAEAARADRALAAAYQELARAGEVAAERVAAAVREGEAHAAELSHLRDEYARRGAELVEARRAAAARAEQVSALAAEVEELSRGAPAPVAPAAPPVLEPATAALQARVRELEEAVAAAEQAHAAPAPRPATPGDPPGALERAVRERDAYAQQLAERDARIARMQREIADKTERLARLAQELSAVKSRGAFGKLFQR